MRTKIDLPQFVNPPCWEVTPPDLSRFFEALHAFVPAGSVLCLEEVEVSDVECYLTARPGPWQNETNQGFLKMRPKVFFMPVTAENLRGLASLSSEHAEPEVCSHLRVYHDEAIILSWHDLPSDPFYVTSEIDEAALRSFCLALGCKYMFDAT
jgi:hypothetical protein